MLFFLNFLIFSYFNYYLQFDHWFFVKNSHFPTTKFDCDTSYRRRLSVKSRATSDLVTLGANGSVMNSCRWSDTNKATGHN